MRRGFLGFFLFAALLTGCAPTANLPPVPVVQVEPTQGEAPLFVHASARGSFDPDGSVAVVRWDFGDGTKKEGVEVVHRYDDEGDFFVTVEVVDNAGLTSTVRLPVQVGLSYPLDVLEWQVEAFYRGTRVFGRVKNIGDRRINLGRVAVRFYDRDWNFVEERSKVLGDLAPGVEQIFEVQSDLKLEMFPHHTLYTEVIHANER